MNSFSNIFSSGKMPKRLASPVQIQHNTTVAVISPSKSIKSITSPQSLSTKLQQEIKNKTLKKKPSVKKHKYFKPPTYTRYIHRVLKQQHPQLSISSKSVLIVDNFIKDMYRQIMYEATQLVKLSKKKTLTHSDINTACKLILTGELQELATNEAAKAMIRYSTSLNKKIRTNSGNSQN